LAAQRERLNSIFSSLKSLNEVPEGWGNRLLTNENRFRGVIVLSSAERFGEATQFRAMIKTSPLARPTAMFRRSVLEHKRASTSFDTSIRPLP
jgi:hypothetical protein